MQALRNKHECLNEVDYNGDESDKHLEAFVQSTIIDTRLFCLSFLSSLDNSVNDG